MAQLNLYVPDELAAELKEEAAAKGVSLSRHVQERLQLRQGPAYAFDGKFWEKLGDLGKASADFQAPKRPGPKQLRTISLD